MEKIKKDKKAVEDEFIVLKAKSKNVHQYVIMVNQMVKRSLDTDSETDDVQMCEPEQVVLLDGLEDKYCEKYKELHDTLVHVKSQMNVLDESIDNKNQESLKHYCFHN